MVKILVDMHLADGIVIASDMQYQLADSSAYYGAILKKYGYTREEFRAAVNSYLKSPLEFEKIYEEVIVQLKEMEKEYAPPASTANAPMPEVATDGTTISAEHEGNSLRELHYELSVAGDTLRVYWY